MVFGFTTETVVHLLNIVLLTIAILLVAVLLLLDIAETVEIKVLMVQELETVLSILMVQALILVLLLGMDVCLITHHYLVKFGVVAL